MLVRGRDGDGWERVRALFRAPRGRTYLDTATYGPLPEGSLEAIKSCLDEGAEGRGRWRDWEEAAERAREAFARLIGVRAECVALLSTVSAAAAQVAEHVPPDANVVVGQGEFRSNLFPWLSQRRRGVEVREVPFRGGGPRLEDLLEAVDRRTALVAISHVQSASGHRIDLERLAPACRERGARLFLDATQSIGALRVPLEGVDYAACAAYKWLLAPRGAAFLYVAPERIGEMTPLCANWKTVEDPYAGYYGPPLEPAARASRFDHSLVWSAWVAAAVSLELLLAIGPERIEARDLALARRFRAGLPRLGLEPLFPEEQSSQITGLAIPAPDAVEASLEREGVVAAVRGGYLRVSPHIFNDEDDVDRALRALKEG